ncbi:MAG: peroxiredoxin [Gammaproteobacteria bacterium]|nr:peroxiredoxin [Gammaproteobacteria bacterium]
MLGSGDKAPEFSLPGGDGEDVSLSSLLRAGPLILYFYPADFTPGCTREACRIRDLHALIRKSGLNVVGVSPQPPASHRRFREQHELPFTLLSDCDKAVIKTYGVDGPLGIGVRRATFLVDPDSVIRGRVLADFRIDRHEAFIRKAVDLDGS